MKRLVILLNPEDIDEISAASIAEMISSKYEGKYDLAPLDASALTEVVRNSHDGIGYRLAVELEPVRIHRTRVQVISAGVDGSHETVD